MVRDITDGQATGVTRTLLRGLAVLEAVAASDESGVGPTWLAEEVGLDKSTITRLLRTLVEAEYVVQDAATHRYRLTAKVLRMAHGAERHLDIRRISQPHLRQLWTDLNETVHLGVMEDISVVYLDKLESTNSIQLVSAVGQTMPLHSTALGKAMLAALGEADREEKIARIDFTAQTANTIRSRTKLRQELRRVQERGYATDDRENEPHGACVAAAIIGVGGKPAGAISISGPEFRVRDHFDDFGERVRAAAAAITWDLGHVNATRPA